MPRLFSFAQYFTALTLSSLLLGIRATAALAQAPSQIEQEIACELLIAGGGLAGTATAYEALLAGRTVCLTEITDWLGGQISAQGTSALDERPTQRFRRHYPRGYLELRDRLAQRYGRQNAGHCWVSAACFFPRDGHEILQAMLIEAAAEGAGTLHWLPNTVIKDLEFAPSPLEPSQRIVTGAIAIQHHPAPGAPPLNTEPLSATFQDAYQYADSDRLTKTTIRLVPATPNASIPWYVIDATETGELLPLAQVPYRLGIDPRSPLDPSASSETADPYCTQGFTYTFAMEATLTPQAHQPPPFYAQYAPYYSYELPRFNFDFIFVYRRIWDTPPYNRSNNSFVISPGDISMQNWTWGNDYRPGIAEDNLIYSAAQLQAQGQLEPGQWQGGLRVEALRKAEELALGYFYWLVAGTTDSQLGAGIKQPQPNHRYLRGYDSPMGTAHGLSKYPYIREGRRLIGRPSPGYPGGFVISEIDLARTDYRASPYPEQLDASDYRALRTFLAGSQAPAVITGEIPYTAARLRDRATLFQDSVGIGHYALDFHPCMALSPPERPGNFERPGERQGAGSAYPFQVPLRALLPQQVDNLIVAGKSVATSHIAAAAHRVHSFEWSVGAAAGISADLALRRAESPVQWIDDLPGRELGLQQLQRELQRRGNPTAFPGMSIFNMDWESWY
ncbi:MAG: FAD-dependent oxidoreductase [Cyanobacteria bacterium P01_G01_bin.54]